MASVAPRNHGYTRRAAAESRRMSNDYLRPWRTGEGRTPQRHKEHLEQLKIVERFARNKSRNATAVYNKYRKLFLGIDCSCPHLPGSLFISRSPSLSPLFYPLIHAGDRLRPTTEASVWSRPPRVQLVFAAFQAASGRL